MNEAKAMEEMKRLKGTQTEKTWQQPLPANPRPT